MRIYTVVNLWNEALKILNSVADSSNQNIENLIKSVKTLTISIPTKAEVFNLFFSINGKSVQNKKVSGRFKSRDSIKYFGRKGY